MSTITGTLRDIGINNGFMVCGEAADEIEALEKSYELLFTENAKLRAEQDEHTPSYAEAFDAIERGAAILTRACDDALDRLATLPQPAAVPSAPMDLNSIRKWPEGFERRLQVVWLDVVSFIPNVKLYDLQRVLAEFGFRMDVYESAAQQPNGDKP